MDNSSLQSAFMTIREEVGDAKGGLGLEVFHFVSSLTPIINVDLLIKNTRHETLLTWRADEFYGPGWHLPGGVVRFKEDPGVRIQKVALSELGCRVKYNDMPLTVRSQTAKDRDVRGHFLSLLYNCSLETTPPTAMEALSAIPMNGQWKWHKNAPHDLVSVHESFRIYINEFNNESR
jgi:colanic acid biosynthesis protein WcaH